MDFQEWEKFYQSILLDFGFDEATDKQSAILLDKILGCIDVDELMNRLEELLKGKIVGVVGAKYEGFIGAVDTLIAADSITSRLLFDNHVPDIVVTDLDGGIDDLVRANEAGSLMLVHAHGDNMDAIKMHSGRFINNVMGTTQTEPFGCLQNFGGFTDGDRAVFLAEHFGAREIKLYGFDFSAPVEKPGTDMAVKAKKLKWAEKLIEMLADRVKIEKI